MKAKEIREMGAEAITAKIAELESERFWLRFRSATQTIENPIHLRAIRRDIARLKTVQAELARQSSKAGA